MKEALVLLKFLPWTLPSLFSSYPRLCNPLEPRPAWSATEMGTLVPLTFLPWSLLSLRSSYPLLCNAFGPPSRPAKLWTLREHNYSKPLLELTISSSNAKTTFVHITRTQTSLKTIWALSCWYSLDSSHWVLSGGNNLFYGNRRKGYTN